MIIILLLAVFILGIIIGIWISSRDVPEKSYDSMEAMPPEFFEQFKD